MLTDEDAINDINPFVTHDFSLPGGVRQTGDFEDFSEIRTETGIPEPTKSVYCDYGLCEESSSQCSLSRELHPRRNIDTGFTENDRTHIKEILVGVANKPELSIIGALIIISTIALILYYARRR